MAIVRSEFALALNQVATERGISPEDVVASIEQAILAAFKKEYPKLSEDEDPESEEEEFTAQVSKTTGETKIFHKGNDITPPGFGRIAAQTARQVIVQKIREAEKRTVTSQYKSQIGSLIKGRIIRYDGYNAYADIGKAEAMLPKEEQMRHESYSVNTTMIFYLKDIREDKHGHSRIIISRSDEQLIAELFKREVPEISAGSVEIKNVVREPGERSKIAVHSAQGGVDPVGACVGQKGVRVQTVTDELGGLEKIDIIQWNSDHKIFLTSALSPARILSVDIDEEGKKAKVTVDETQAPLAIGKNGINVNLASRLTGYEIDIIQSSSTDPSQEDKVVASTDTDEEGGVEIDHTEVSTEAANEEKES
jgi:N utilization substance protein A